MPLFNPNLMTIVGGISSATGPVISFSNANGVSFGINGNTITASVANGGGVAISAGAASVSSGTVVFSNSNNISFGLNGSTITASVAAAATVLAFSQWAEFGTHYTVSNGMISFQKVSLPVGFTGATGVLLVDLSGHSNSSGGVCISVGVYSITSQTANVVSTALASFSWTSGSQTSASSMYGGVSGTRYRSFSWQPSLAPGDYVVAVAFSTSNDGQARVFGRQGVQIVGTFAGVETAFFLDGVSVSSAAALPISLVATNTNYARTGLSAAQQPGLIMIGIN